MTHDTDTLLPPIIQGSLPLLQSVISPSTGILLDNHVRTVGDAMALEEDEDNIARGIKGINVSFLVYDMMIYINQLK